MLVRNPFLVVPVEEALSAAGLDLLRLSSIASAHPPLRILVADLEELGPQGAHAVTQLCSAGTAVLVFGRSEHAAALRALQARGALTAERTPFLVNLPELITLALDARSG